MNRSALMILVAAAFALGGGWWLWNNIISPQPLLDLEPLNYTEDSSWAALPVQTPPAVWSGEWGVDVFVVSKDARLVARTQVGLEKRERVARAQADALRTYLQPVGEVYAPLFRGNAESDDITRAFETYLRTDNRGRALVITHDMPLPDSVLARLEQDPELRNRFGGFLSLSTARTGITPLYADGSAPNDEGTFPWCNARLNEANSCQMIVPARKVKGLWVLESEGVPGGDMIATFPDWLEANVGKMAEPLGDFEEIEIVEIRRPGDTDERRAENGNDD